MPGRPVHLPLWSLAVLVVAALLGPVLSIVASVQIAEKNAKKVVEQQEAAKLEAQAEARRVTCAFFASSLDVYNETPPATPAGKAQRENYLELYRLTGCQPPRTR